MRFQPQFGRVIAFVVLVGCIAVLAGQLLALLSLFAFEYSPLTELLGVRGVLMIACLDLGVLLGGARMISILRRRPFPFVRSSNALLIVAAGLFLWALQWMFLAMPLTARVALRFADSGPIVLAPTAADDFTHFSLVTRLSDDSSREALRTMYARIRVNSVEVFERHPLAATIDKYASKYQIDPAYLFFRSYLNSWYGEAPSGPIPFLRQMTPETVRDVVQVHLPSWFVESGLRTGTIASTDAPRLLGSHLGFEIRYALHKATLDVSSQPYDLNTFSDIFLILKEYPGEFADILSAAQTDPLRAALRDAFLAVRDSALVPPYLDAYKTAPYNADFYAKFRTEMRRFSRAAYYLCALDFDFATRVQSLLSKFERNYYVERLGAERWSSLPAWQQVAMLAMVRDLYRPNVGHLGYNVYALPELNCAPLEFVASSAAAATNLGKNQETLWRPDNYDVLWAGAGYQLSVLNEVWTVVYGHSMHGVGKTSTTDAAHEIVVLNR